MGLTGVPFDTVLQQVMEVSEGNHDVVLPTSALVFSGPDTDRVHGSLVHGGADTYPLTWPGYRSLMKRLSLPTRYMTRLDGDEQAEHVNMWLPDQDTSWFVRLNALNSIRSIQPAGFTPVDILPVLELMEPVIRTEGMIVTHHVPNLDDFHMRAVWPTSYGDSTDVLHAGFHLNASEAGAHPFTLDAACYRNSCLNTAILRRGRALFSQPHRGLNFDEFRPRLLEGLERVRVVGRNLCVALDRCRAEEMPPSAMQEELRELLNLRILPKRIAEQCHDAVEEGRYEEATRFGLINLITRQAQELDGAEERKFRGRMRIENVAGKLLLPFMGTTIASPAPVLVTAGGGEQTASVEAKMQEALGGLPDITEEVVPQSSETEEATSDDVSDDDLESLLGADDGEPIPVEV